MNLTDSSYIFPISPKVSVKLLELFSVMELFLHYHQQFIEVLVSVLTLSIFVVFGDWELAKIISILLGVKYFIVVMIFLMVNDIKQSIFLSLLA